jgi:hypothetical protein
LYPVPSAAAAGNTAAAGKAADSAAVEQIPFIRALREKSELIERFSSLIGIASAVRSVLAALLEEQPGGQ